MPASPRSSATALHRRHRRSTAFEQEYAEFVGARHCVGVANGTDALELALRAVGVGAGDEVIVPANTFIATAEAVVAGRRPAGARRRRRRRTCSSTRERSQAAITARTRAVIPVAPLRPGRADRAAAGGLAERGIAVVEDAAQSQGAPRHGRAAGAFGAHRRDELLPGQEPRRLRRRRRRHHGRRRARRRACAAARQRTAARSKYQHARVGFNSRLDTLQAVVLRAKLRRLPVERRSGARPRRVYDELLAGVAGVRLAVTLARQRARLAPLRRPRGRPRRGAAPRCTPRGIGAGIHYPVPVHLTPALAELGPPDTGTCPVPSGRRGRSSPCRSSRASREEQQERVVEVLADARGPGLTARRPVDDADERGAADRRPRSSSVPAPRPASSGWPPRSGSSASAGSSRWPC